MSASEQKGRQLADLLEIFKEVLEECYSRAFTNGYEQATSQFQPAIAAFQQAISRQTQPQKKPKQADSRRWPILEGNTLSYNGKSVELQNSRYIELLQMLLEAKGESLSTQELSQAYGGKKSTVRTAIARLRKLLQKQMPEIAITTDFGSSSYRIALNKRRRRA